MPIYGYRCHSCQCEFETQQRMSDPPQADCPDCGAAGTRLFYPAGILFKGSGFYKTDSRSTPATAAPATATEPKPASSGGSETATPAPATTSSPAPAPTPKASESSKPSSPKTD